MPSGIQNWSKTPASNSNADSSINWAEGQAPSSVNDSARAVMARVAEWRDDLGGITTTGSSTAYAITTNRNFSGSGVASMDGQIIVIKPHTNSGANPTLAVDGLTARAINRSSASAVGTGNLRQGGVYVLVYLHATTEFVLIMGGGGISGLDIDGSGIVLTAPDTADEAIVYDASAANNAKITLGNLFKVVDTLTAKTAPVLADELSLYDVSGAAASKLALTNLLKIIDLLTAKTTPTSADELVIYDVAGTAPKKVTFAQMAAAFIPTVQRFTSGSGTYTPTSGVGLIKVRISGGGGGGGAQVTNNGTNGNTTTFGSWTALGGSGGTANSTTGGNGGTGGANGTGTLIVRIDGGRGFVSSQGISQITNAGGAGGANPFGGAGAPNGNAAGSNGTPNTGAGGAGGGSLNGSSGTGGGAGEYVEFWVSAPGATSYTVGAAANGGAAGGAAGGNGAAGIIIIEEFYA